MAAGTKLGGRLNRAAERDGTRVLEGSDKIGSDAVGSGPVDGFWTANVGEGRETDEAEAEAALPAMGHAGQDL